MTLDIQRSAETGAEFDAEIDDIIKRAPTVTAESLAVAVRVTLDAHNRYDVVYTRTLKAVAMMPEPARATACVLLADMADENIHWPAYKAAVDALREWGIDPVPLRPADRLVISKRVRRASAPLTPIPVHLVSE